MMMKETKNNKDKKKDTNKEVFKNITAKRHPSHLHLPTNNPCPLKPNPNLAHQQSNNTQSHQIPTQLPLLKIPKSKVLRKMAIHRALIKTHHMTSRVKIRSIRKSTKTLSCAAVLKTGKPPGVMVVEAGREEDLRSWVGVVRVCFEFSFFFSLG